MSEYLLNSGTVYTIDHSKMLEIRRSIVKQGLILDGIDILATIMLKRDLIIKKYCS